MTQYLRIFLAALLLVGGTLTLSAQTGIGNKGKFKPRFMIGVTGGGTMSEVRFNPKIQQQYKYGTDMGLILRADVESYAGVWLEVDYTQRGWSDYYENNKELYYHRNLTFINVPFMTHFMIGTGPLKVTIDAGPHFGYLLSESSDTNVTSENAVGIVTAHHDLPVKNRFSWGLGGGAGVEYHLKRHLVIGARGSFQYALGDLFGNTRSDTFGNSNEQVISAKAYLLFAF